MATMMHALIVLYFAIGFVQLFAIWVASDKPTRADAALKIVIMWPVLWLHMMTNLSDYGRVISSRKWVLVKTFFAVTALFVLLVLLINVAGG